MIGKSIFLFSFVFVYVLADDLVIELPDGKIRGHQKTTLENISFYAWQGIPYATPPLGELRFKAPIPPKSWSGIKSTISTGDSCLTLLHYNLDPDLGNQSEDCLYLNIYAPAKKSLKKLPVMLWIYGGGFISGCSNEDFYGPDYIVNEDVIVVDFNYRLALLGFLSTGDEVILGNAGLKDQLLALQWTKNNIHLFGGDPEQITIFGESAGGFSVGVHIWNKKSAGLFRAAICESGCSLSMTSDLSIYKQKMQTYKLAKEIDLTISDLNTTQEVANILQSVSADELIAASERCSFEAGVIAEPDNEKAFITREDAVRIRNLLENGEFNHVPLIIGTNANEGLSFAKPLSNIKRLELEYDNDVTNLIPKILHPKNGTNLADVGNLIKKTYVGENGSFSNNTVEFLEFYSDSMFGRGSIKQAELQSNFTPVYLYQFSYYGTVSELRGYPDIPGIKKVGHADDFPYLFKVSTFDLKTSMDFQVRKRIVKLWTNFAKTLNPTPDPSDPLLNVTWGRVTPDNIQYLDIDETLEMKPNRKVKEFAMWNYVYDTYGTPPFSGF